jgi:hypothetical protein
MLLHLLVPQEHLTQEEREERRRAAEMETAVRLQREREEAEAARAEQLRKEVRGLAESLVHGAQRTADVWLDRTPACGLTAAQATPAAQPQLECKLLPESATPQGDTPRWHLKVCMQPKSGAGRQCSAMLATRGVGRTRVCHSHTQVSVRHCAVPNA